MEKLKKFVMLLMAAVTTFAMSAIVFASDSSTPDIATTIGTAATTAQGQALGVINTLIPIVMVIVSTIAVVTLGIRLFKRFMRG